MSIIITNHLSVESFCLCAQYQHVSVQELPCVVIYLFKKVQYVRIEHLILQKKNRGQHMNRVTDNWP